MLNSFSCIFHIWYFTFSVLLIIWFSFIVSDSLTNGLLFFFFFKEIYSFPPQAFGPLLLIVTFNNLFPASFHKINDLNSLKFVETWFMVQHLVNFGKWFMYTWKKIHMLHIPVKWGSLIMFVKIFYILRFSFLLVLDVSISLNLVLMHPFLLCFCQILLLLWPCY